MTLIQPNLISVSLLIGAILVVIHALTKKFYKRQQINGPKMLWDTGAILTATYLLISGLLYFLYSVTGKLFFIENIVELNNAIGFGSIALMITGGSILYKTIFKKKRK